MSYCAVRTNPCGPTHCYAGFADSYLIYLIYVPSIHQTYYKRHKNLLFSEAEPDVAKIVLDPTAQLLTRQSPDCDFGDQL